MPDFQTLSLSHSLSLQVPLKQWVSSTTTWIVTDPLADCFLLLANRTVSDAIAVHGKDPNIWLKRLFASASMTRCTGRNTALVYPVSISLYRGKG